MRAPVVRRRRFRVLEPLDPRILDAEALRKINPDLLTLFNVDAPQDVARAERIAYGDVS
jgi:hypothetical protein